MCLVSGLPCLVAGTGKGTCEYDTKKDASVMLAGIFSDIMSACMADCLVCNVLPVGGG